MPKISAMLASLLVVACGGSSPPASQPAPPSNVQPAPTAKADARKPFPKLDPAIYEAQIARTGQTSAPKIDPLPEYGIGIAACDDLLLRITACRTMPNKPKVFVRAMWDVFKGQLDHGGDRKEIERRCGEEAGNWNERLAVEQPGC